MISSEIAEITFRKYRKVMHSVSENGGLRGLSEAGKPTRLAPREISFTRYHKMILYESENGITQTQSQSLHHQPSSRWPPSFYRRGGPGLARCVRGRSQACAGPPCQT